MKTPGQCPKCGAPNIRSEVLQGDHINLAQLGPVTFAGRDLAGWRSLDSCVCAGCGFNELCYRLRLVDGLATLGASSAGP